jgi:hypothetical protein
MFKFFSLRKEFISLHAPSRKLQMTGSKVTSELEDFWTPALPALGP